MSPDLAARPGLAAPQNPDDRRPVWALIMLCVVAAVCVVLFCTVGLQGAWEYVLRRRLLSIAALAIVAVAISVSSVVFHTISENRILTPSIMGFDSLYMLVQTIGIFLLGVSLGTLPAVPTFAFTVALMVGFSLALYGWLLLGAGRGLHALILIGIVFAGLFRSIQSFIARLLDPNQFVVLQDRGFASFTRFDAVLLAPSAVLVGVVVLLLWRMRRTLDVMALGRETALALGVDHRRIVIVVLVCVSVLVSVSTALVGPTTFFGLLAAHLAYTVTRTSRHAITLPAAVLGSVAGLIGGQLVVQHVFGFATALSIVIEFGGGLLLIALLLRRRTL